MLQHHDVQASVATTPVFKTGANHKTRPGAQFTVGVSDPAKDWPAVQPGPRDKWAGPQAHTNVVTFHVDEHQAGSGAYLVLRLMDSHPNSPPMLYVELNGCRREFTLLQRNGADRIL